MDAVGSTIALAQGAEVCLKLGKQLVATYCGYKHANERIAELVIQLEGISLKTEIQIGVLEEINDTLPAKLREFQEASFRRLESKLRLAFAELETIAGPHGNSISLQQLSISAKSTKRFKYAFLEKHLRKTVDELRIWQSTFDPSWLLLIRMKDSRVDDALKEAGNSHETLLEVDTVQTIRAAIESGRVSTASERGGVFREPSFLNADSHPISGSKLKLSQTADTKFQVLLDTTSYPPDTNLNLAVVHVRDLAKILSASNPSILGLLTCLGVLKQLDSSGTLTQLQFVFAIPPGLRNPASLRSLLTRPSPSLDTKLCIAKSLARSVMAVHFAHLVHKNIRPETFIVFENDGNPTPSSFLVGFERFRPATAITGLVGDMVWERNLYRYPNRQGIRPEEYYIMQHDIYSLGVCLLEIGLWSSFVTLSEPPAPGPILSMSQQLSMTNKTQAAWEIKRMLISMAKQDLPSRMGLAYTEIVVSSMSCLDSSATNPFGEETHLYDEDGILVGVAFIEKIMTKLEAISI